MSEVLLQGGRANANNIDKLRHAAGDDVLVQDMGHITLEGCWSIGETEGYHEIHTD